MLSVSRACFYEQRAAGRIGPQIVKIGRKNLLRRAEVEDWILAGLPPRRAWCWKSKRATR